VRLSGRFSAAHQVKKSNQFSSWIRHGKYGVRDVWGKVPCFP
jgi:hypothetical protein